MFNCTHGGGGHMSAYLEMHVNHSSIHPMTSGGFKGPWLSLELLEGRRSSLRPEWVTCLSQRELGTMVGSPASGLPGRPFLAGPLSAAANSQTAAPLVAAAGTAFPAGPPAAQPLVRTRGPPAPSSSPQPPAHPLKDCVLHHLRF